MVFALAAVALAGTADRANDAVGGVVGTPSLTLRAAAPDGATTVVVTHHELRFDVLSFDVAPARVDITVTDVLGSRAALGSAWPQLDHWSVARANTSALCGLSADLDFALASSSDDEERPVQVERMRFGGEVCPQFVDADADGACPQGQDQDHDGFCVSIGEVAPQGEEVDCNDTARGPGCIDLAVDPRDDGGTALTATAVPAGEVVWFFGSPRRGQSCPPALGGVCIDLAMPRALGTAVADADGMARLVVAAAPSGFYQAGVLGLQMDSDFSAAIAATGVPTTPTQATEP